MGTIALLTYCPMFLATSKVSMVQHGRIHALGDAAAASWLPWDIWYYQCHILGHHFDGTFCSVTNPALVMYDPIFYVLGYAVSSGDLQFGSTTWHMICVMCELIAMAATILNVAALVRCPVRAQCGRAAFCYKDQNP